eukprot:TRINITY_DN508_c2_g3_i1.p1 TRINITY_DN508_c2_g3~~TRINITY_DN508_c2_g3_i1.p1  ORF type:complete len:506 (+),score=84.98 TRINITY_DN508_c2_g3_i1:57-1574(+)
MSVSVKIVKAVGLVKKDAKKDLSAYVTVRFAGEEESTAVKQGSANPVWNETLELSTAEEDGTMSIEVYDRNMMRRKLLGKAQLNIKEKHGGVVLKLRGERRTSRPVSLGTISLEWTVNTDLCEFKQNLTLLTENSYHITLPIMWLSDLLSWHRPSETAFFLLLWTYTCLYNQFDLLVPAVVVGVMLNSFYQHCRWGPEPPKEASIESRYPDPFKFLGDGKQESQRLYASQVWLGDLVNNLDSVWDVVSFKNVKVSNFIVNFLLAWIVLELVGFCPGLNVLAMLAVWVVFLLYPMHVNFPNIAAHYNLFTFLTDAEVSMGGNTSQRITYQPLESTPAATPQQNPSSTPQNAALAGSVSTWLESTSNPPSPDGAEKRPVKPADTELLNRSSLSPQRLTEWGVSHTLITKTETRKDTTYYKLETEFLNGDTREIWHRYSHFRSLKAAVDKYDTMPHPPPFPGKTFGKCEGKELLKRQKALEAFVIEVTNRSHANMRLRGVVSRFLGTR